MDQTLQAVRHAEMLRIRRRRRIRVIGVAVAAAVVAGAITLSGLAEGDNNTERDRVRVDGEKVYGNLSRNHVVGRITYPPEPNPPVGGDHNPRWQNANGDVYDRPIQNEYAVHSLEHGAVWLTYNEDATPEMVAVLRTKVAGRPYRMMSPVPDQEGLIKLTAWGHQLTVSSVEDPRIDEFLRTYVQGPQTPEIGAVVTNGRAEP